jgi:methylated-DNA-[protein]-cysteine S-methyltransferase
MFLMSFFLIKIEKNKIRYKLSQNYNKLEEKELFTFLAGDILFTMEAAEEHLTVLTIEKNGLPISQNLSSLAQKLKTELEAYLAGNLKDFTIPLRPQGTDFQKSVWLELQKIAYGHTRTYAQMAHNLGDPKVIRAAATANGKNPIMLLIPCHRVIGTDGSLTGYAGGLHNKKRFLDIENKYANGVLSLF